MRNTTRNSNGSNGSESAPQVAVIMGSRSDWPTMKRAVEVLDRFRVAHESSVVSAHRSPDRMAEFAKSAARRGIQVIIAGAGGAAHLPGMVSAWTTLPVLGVPVQSKALNGMDSLLSIAQMPAGVPTATFAIGEAGAANAGLFAIRMLAAHDPELRQRLEDYANDQVEHVLAQELL